MTARERGGLGGVMAQEEPFPVVRLLEDARGRLVVLEENVSRLMGRIHFLEGVINKHEERIEVLERRRAESGR